MLKWFHWGGNKDLSLDIQPPVKEDRTVRLYATDSIRTRCGKAWRCMGFVNDRGGCLAYMESVFKDYATLDAMFKPTHKHKKGRFYQVIGEGYVEATMERAVIYKNDLGILWIRPSEEFYDGRFTPVEELENDVSSEP